MRPSFRQRVRHGRSGEVILILAVVVGLAVSTRHWVGLVLGGALVGLVAPSMRRAFVLGLYYGFIVLGAFAIALALAGGLAKYLAMGQVFVLSLALAVGLAPLGALASRGLS